MILGTGIDIIEVARIAQAHEAHGDRFLTRILRAEEIAYCLAQRFPARHLAARFAAKEAVSKALGTGIGSQLGWQDIEVSRHPSGQPFIVLHGKGRALLQSRQGHTVHVSLSHTDTHATAVAVVVL